MGGGRGPGGGPAARVCEGAARAPREWGGALLVVLYRLRRKGSYQQLAEHKVFSTTPGHKWSPTKLKIIFRAAVVEPARLHNPRLAWSKQCFADAPRYALALCTKMGLPFHNDVCFIIDGTHRAQSRPASKNGQDRQREYYNGWLHKHCLGYQAVVAPDGLIASIAGPYPGSKNDHQKLALSNFVATFTAQCPGHKVLADAGYTFNPAGVMVRAPPGAPFPPGAPWALYSKALASTREAVEWPFGHVSSAFPFLDDRSQMKTCTVVAGVYRAAVLLNNCLLCCGHGNRQVPQYFGCEPPRLADYLR